ncbi:hypothetical protein C8F04DRAFT_1027764 [Mycena alexandri]|uniref:SP-RING-type domain-containing protein n=1 Tax=Mycena alexandri TaxID=1745969 RepID=A0AAD6TDI7_9AGAR|nr:hypothetical protein C8F04DRAFT_1027764 [Mycena alexandri]
MPVATSRRRKSARQASSDIEEDQATQAAPVRDDVDEGEDDALQRTRVKKEKVAVKKEKGKAKATASKEEPEEDDDDDDRIDVQNFADQPLTKADCAKINGLATDWLNVEEVMHQHSPFITNAATSMAEVAGEEAQEGVAELDRVMKDLLDIQALMKGHSKVLSDIIQNVATGEDITNAKETYLSLVDDMNAEYDKMTTRQKYLNNEQYVNFKEGVYDAEHSGSAMPPMTDFIPREEGDESDDDDDVVMGGVTQEYKCPLLMTILKDPLTSSVCKHSFSGDALREYFKSARGALKCPTSGCSKKFTLAECQPNPDLIRKIKAYERRQKRAQEDSDAEEVID